MNDFKYDAVIFDLDGTLVDSMWVWNRIDIDFLAEHGIRVPEDIEKDLEGKSFTESAVYFKDRFKFDMDIEDIKSKWNQMAENYYINEVRLKEGAEEFLKWLYDMNIKIGIATSNSRQLAEAVLKAQNVYKYFTAVKTSCEAGRGKPFPDIYLLTAKSLNVKPEKCLVFEDIPNGVIAGKSAGMTVWAVKDRQAPKMTKRLLEVSDEYVKNYFEAQKKLKNS